MFSKIIKWLDFCLLATFGLERWSARFFINLSSPGSFFGSLYSVQGSWGLSGDPFWAELLYSSKPSLFGRGLPAPRRSETATGQDLYIIFLPFHLHNHHPVYSFTKHWTLQQNICGYEKHKFFSYTIPLLCWQHNILLIHRLPKGFCNRHHKIWQSQMHFYWKKSLD